jgi:EAL domain-containing protein (putative c-di-GMP-specific phosphodiesterase class I)
VKGVETPPQAASLRGEGCDEAQRHLYAKPLVNSEFRKLLNSNDGALAETEFQVRRLALHA